MHNYCKWNINTLLIYKQTFHPLLKFRYSCMYTCKLCVKCHSHKFFEYLDHKFETKKILLNLRLHYLGNLHQRKITHYTVLVALPTFQCSMHNCTLCCYLILCVSTSVLYTTKLSRGTFAFTLQNGYAQNGSMLVDLQFTR